MLKIKILVALIILTANNGNCQNKAYDDKTEIHKSVAKILRKEGTKFSVLGTTKKNIFSNFAFSEGGGGLDTSPNRPWNKKEWIGFVKSIDTSAITNYSLNIHKTSQKHAENELIFAPIIFSKENDKALCIWELHSVSSGSGQVAAWYYEKEKEKWILKGSQIVSISD
ncbi:hypothetical protein [Pedobacter boryungensis]|nr:hypothetical protein [Pedobacter boryungensis]